ncbi:NADPH-dependent 7-cyano-7-deazaguanine reductase QueF [Alcaligenaceae bacterium LF4-65]|uniref:NADPH-dependent 7-cyano-7-deazaguanine reductase n=1 Tax=Zwartia hollandica TaxID=324606 RepID=A0A953NA16_9BURK|nr:NADPH-dependent 7-cyano-7-deazaguanine reductase QueF [Zwartia hollandica]MBZ1349470.1 NADPH-dependent 7-cyano-7-deazaguanine reductase QueF [Zwartia hollandica]
MIKPTEALALGKITAYPSEYDPGLLFPIPRQTGRADLGVAQDGLPFVGWDLWNAYEVSWLTPNGLPRVALLRVQVNALSTNIIESKSFKLYLNSLNQTRFSSSQLLLETLAKDLSAVCGNPVLLSLIESADFAEQRISEPTGICLDDQDVVIDCYTPDDSLLRSTSTEVVKQSVYSRLLKSNCPITNQPDWACVQIDYTGPQIDLRGLLKYIVSFRDHGGFHEHCVERIFTDIMQRCMPTKLSVYARYTRRGGLDINPWRATVGMPEPGLHRSARQ